MGSKGCAKLATLQQLSTLICGYNSVKPKDIVMLAKHSPLLTKLSLANMKMTDSEMKDLGSEGNLAHTLTHLDIRLW